MRGVGGCYYPMMFFVFVDLAALVGTIVFVLQFRADRVPMTPCPYAPARSKCHLNMKR